MRLARKIRSFRARRIDFPITPGALVLDVGSGDKPSWRADVLLDGYPGDEHAGQRSGTGHVEVDRPLFDADAADMPFADHAFDFAICSHVLEHVTDPGRVIDELTRVARAGYIEVPEAAAAKLVDFPTHLWWCRLDESVDPPVLTFEAKSTPYFDAEIDAYLRRTGMEPRLEALLDAQFHDNVVSVWWTSTVAYRVTGTLDPDFVRRTFAADAPHHAGRSLSSQVLTRVFTGRGHRPRRVPHDDVVKVEYRVGDDRPLESRIYRYGR